MPGRISNFLILLLVKADQPFIRAVIRVGVLVMVMTCIVIISNAQSLTYSILKNNKEIGKLHITRQPSGDSTIYLLQSASQAYLLFRFQINSYLRVVFFKEQLISYKLVQEINEKITENKEALWSDSEYVIRNRNTVVSKPTELIYYTIAMVYYNEPIKIKRVFSESYQQFIRIKTVGSNKYMLEFPNGNTTTYSFKKGVCNEVTAITNWVEIKFKLEKTAIGNNLITGYVK